jgi:hypothetical protein
MSFVKTKYASNKAVSEWGYETDDLLADVQSTSTVYGTLYRKTVTISSAEILALNTTPKTLVSAGGADTTILVQQIIAKGVGETRPYTGANALEFRYTNGSGVKVSADLPATLINAADATTVLGTVSGVATALVPVANAAVVAFVPVANPGANVSGDDSAEGTIEVTVYYYLADFN